jgi:5-methylthioribose kinase
MDKSYLLNPQQAVEFVQRNTTLFPKEAELDVTEISNNQLSVEGYVNSIYRIKDRKSEESVVFKQFRHYLKDMEEINLGQPLPLARMKVEIEAFRLWNAICPGSVPEIHAWDEEKAIIIMEDLAPMKLARFELARRKKFPYFAKQVGEFLGKTAFYTSDLYLNSIDKKNLVKRFMNPEYRELLERIIFDRFFFHSPEEPLNPEIQEDIQGLLSDERILLEILKLKDTYMIRAQSLIHNDFHTANIFLGADRMKVFDGEGSFIGPTAYDIGELFGSLILSCMSLQVVDDITLSEKIDYEDYLLRTMEEIHHEFERTFSEAWDNHVKPEYRKSSAYKDDYLKRILQEAAGYAACLALSRIYDLGMSYDFSRIQDLHQRAVGQRLLIQSARQLILDRERFARIEDITAMLKQIKTGHKIATVVTEKLMKHEFGGNRRPTA